MRNSRLASVARFVSLAAVPLAMTLAAGSASAQAYPSQQRGRGANSEQELFEWTGRVDREIRIQAGRNNAQIVNMGSNERNNGGRIRSFTTMPRQAGVVRVQVLEGRGNVDVVQQPSARNGYTTVVRLRDGDSGSARYRIAAYFTPDRNNNGRYNNGNNNGYPRR